MSPSLVFAASVVYPEGASALTFPPPGILNGTSFGSGAAGISLPDELVREAEESGDKYHHSNNQHHSMMACYFINIGDNISTAGILFRNLEDFLSALDPEVRYAGIIIRFSNHPLCTALACVQEHIGQAWLRHVVWSGSEGEDNIEVPVLREQSCQPHLCSGYGNNNTYMLHTCTPAL